MLSLRKIIVIPLLFLIPTVALAQTTEAPSSANDICPILIGSNVPEATLTTETGASFDLNAAIGKKPTILIFYRGGW